MTPEYYTIDFSICCLQDDLKLFNKITPFHELYPFIARHLLCAFYLKRRGAKTTREHYTTDCSKCRFSVDFDP